MEKEKVRSLKKFFMVSSIKSEVKKWKPPEMLAYLQKHADDTNQSKSTQKKLDIVWGCFVDKISINESVARPSSNKLNEFFRKKSTKNIISRNTELTEKILNNQSVKNELCRQSDLVETVIEKNTERIKNDPSFRKLFGEPTTFISALKRLKVVPNEAKDPDNVRLPSSNTGIYLWTQGYQVINFLGAGGFGVVWECIGHDRTTHKAVKVVNKGSKEAYEEIENVKKLYDMFKNDEKAQKYFNLLKTKKNNDSPILKAVLAQGDWSSAVDNKKDSTVRVDKNLSSMLRNMEQAVKAVKKLHDAGYSHNDIKPENFLKISNWESKKNKLHAKQVFNEKQKELAEITDNKNYDDQLKQIYEFLEVNKVKSHKIEEIKNSNLEAEKKAKQIFDIINRIIKNKIHKSRVQLADFGSVTSIKNDFYQPIHTKGYVPESDKKFLSESQYIFLDGGFAPEEAKEKRDVYALGVTFLVLLFKMKIDRQQLVKDIRTKPMETLIYDLNNIYPGEDDERLKTLLLIMKDMTEDNYEKRITVEDALNRIRALRGK